MTQAVMSSERLTSGGRRAAAPASHRACVDAEAAQDDAVVDVEELDGEVACAGERVLVVGRATATT